MKELEALTKEEAERRWREANSPERQNDMFIELHMEIEAMKSDEEVLREQNKKDDDEALDRAQNEEPKVNYLKWVGLALFYFLVVLSFVLMLMGVIE